MKKSYLLPIIILLFMSVYGCHSSGKSDRAIDSIPGYVRHPKTAADSDKNDSLVMAQVEKLPEFNNILNWYQKNNKDTTHHISVSIGQEPAKGFGYYWIRIGDDDAADNYTGMESFYVDTTHLEVHYLDAQTDSVMTIDKWRKSGKDRWQKMPQ